MNTTTEELATTETAPLAQPELPQANNHKADAKQLRTEAVGALLGQAYHGASTLKLKAEDVKKLTADFPDDAIEIRPHDGLIYISHMLLRERLWSVFGPTETSEIIRERMMSFETNEIMVDLVLMARGKFLAEGIGSAKWLPNNPKTSKSDVIESAWSEALRRCCKRIGVGTQVWRPAYVREWLEKNAVQTNGRWYRKDNAPVTAAHRPPKTKEYVMKEPTEFQKMKAAVQGTEPVDEDGDSIPF